jgi:hypothetical protein
MGVFAIKIKKTKGASCSQMQDQDDDAGSFHIDAAPVDETPSLEWGEHDPALEEPLLSQVLTHGDDDMVPSTVEVSTEPSTAETTIPRTGAERKNRDPSTFDTMPFEFDEVCLDSGNPKAESLTPSPLGGSSKYLPCPKTRSELDARIEALQYPSCMD